MSSSHPLQVDCLVLQLHRIGEQLEKANSQRMDQLFFLLRDGFLLQEGLTSMTRLLLLEILEFRAGGWMLSSTANKYYYSEISDWRRCKALDLQNTWEPSPLFKLMTKKTNQQLFQAVRTAWRDNHSYKSLVLGVLCRLTEKWWLWIVQ